MKPSQRYSDFSPRTLQWLRGALALALIAALAASAFVQVKGHFGLDSTPFFYAWFGAASCALIVLVSNLLGYVLKRPDHYYDERKP